MYLWLPFGSFGSFGSFATFAPLAALALAFRLVLRAAALGSMIGGDATLASSYLLISSSQVVQFSSGSLRREVATVGRSAQAAVQQNVRRAHQVASLAG